MIFMEFMSEDVHMELLFCRSDVKLSHPSIDLGGRQFCPPKQDLVSIHAVTSSLSHLIQALTSVTSSYGWVHTLCWSNGNKLMSTMESHDHTMESCDRTIVFVVGWHQYVVWLVPGGGKLSQFEKVIDSNKAFDSGIGGWPIQYLVGLEGGGRCDDFFIFEKQRSYLILYERNCIWKHDKKYFLKS